MKKYITILLFGGIALSSCKKDFLEEVATNQVASGSYFRNYAEANTVVLGIYAHLREVYSFELVAGWGINGTDEVSVPTWAGLRRDLHKYNVQSNNGDILLQWKNNYTGIYRANQVIARVGAMTASQIKEEDKNRLIGEAKFLRALFYFNLVKMFGGVPLVTAEVQSESDIPNSRASIEDIYAQIIDDLKFAKQHTRSSLLSGAATKGAATAILGRVYLQMTGWPLNDKSKYELAAKELKEVIDNPSYGLAANYADVFSEFKETTPESMKENIFVVKFDGPGKGLGGKMGTYMGPSGNVADGGAFQTTFVNARMALLYDSAKDVRFFQNIAIRNAANGNINAWAPGWQPMKWVKPQKWINGTVPNYAYDSPIDFAIIRFSDVLLMYAEALNGMHNGPTQEALDAVNRVRRRAARPGTTGLPDYTLAMGMTKETFIDTLLKERYFELGFEGLRKDDLIRTGRLFSYVRSQPDERFDNAGFGKPGDIQDFHRLWPIPNAEVLVSKLPQNEGY